MKIMYFVHELNDQGDVIGTLACADPLSVNDSKAFMKRHKKPFRIERATLNESGVVVNKEDIT